MLMTRYISKSKDYFHNDDSSMYRENFKKTYSFSPSLSMLPIYKKYTNKYPYVNKNGHNL